MATIYPLSDSDKTRLQNYQTNEKIFLGDHIEAFNIMSKDFAKDFSHLEYITINLGGMISRLSADMLFEEPPTIRVEKDKAKWFQSLYQKNKLDVQFYESALESSYRGDAVFRIRAEAGECIIEDLNPSTYFAIYDPKNLRKEVKEHVIGTEVTLEKLIESGKPAKGLLVERHLKGKIITELYQIKGTELIGLDLNTYYPDIQPEVNTNINDFLIFHVKNYGINSMYYGISDYKDLISLMYAVNSRLTRIDNIINRHGDPILAVPKGVLNDDGTVRREAFGIIEVDTSEGKSGAMPQYIVWDAKLESAMAEIDKLLELFYMVSETSQASFGIDKEGIAESGRALKFKLIRTLAKKHRKQLYYDYAIKQMVKVAEEFSKANKLTANGVKAPTSEAQYPDIIWNDGIVNDAIETLDIEERKLASKLTTRAEAIAVIEGLDQQDAIDKMLLIDEEAKKSAPKFLMNPYNPKDPINKTDEVVQ